MRIGAAADIQEVGRLAAVHFYHVHGSHGQSGAVYHITDVSIQFDKTQPFFFGFHFDYFICIGFEQLFDFRLTEHGVVVEIHFAVQSQQFIVVGDYQRIDFHQRCVGIKADFVHFPEQIGGLFYQIEVVEEPEGNFSGSKRCHTQICFDGHFDDGIGIFFGHFFDFHAAFAAGHQDDRFGIPVDGHAYVNFRMEFHSFGQQDFFYLVAFDVHTENF